MSPPQGSTVPAPAVAPLPLAPAGRQHSLGWRLVWTTLIFCVFFILVSVAALTWTAWNAGVERMDAELAQIEQIYSGTLSKAIWELDREALQAHVQSVRKVPAVGSISVQVALANRPAEVFEASRTGWTGPGRAPTRHLVLSYEPYPGAHETVGELVLQGNEHVLWQQLRRQLATIVAAQLLQSLMLAGLIMLVFHRMVTVHVRRIAEHLARMGPGNLSLQLQLERPRRRRDELTQLESGVNQLQASLAVHLESQRRYEQELAAHRDDLARLVAERTAELESANARLQSLARTDTLTGLPNRRHFDETQAMELRRARRSSQSLALLVCDIDSFKDYNDHYGHAMGDRCLSAVAQALKTHLVRAGDLVARIGGEEFGVILPNTDRLGAQLLAERLVKAVADCGIAHAHSPAARVVTISVGLAVLHPDSDDDFDALFQRADAALYRAKAAGRNQVAGLD
ncbi:MAG: diguanylate cyclase [Simplicispira suum]|uniref:diguanylate cyclase domain-containing protein n=1 Tax=Simplicispira suum TaxID=2109915 RepID=UPI001C6CFD63|nr:diguanylate cyclase [Simplicispira suum]MBW7833425.1 diguanylate cyclase [Simplicispira suum]